MILRSLSNPARSIEVGALYRRMGMGAIVEMARVLELGSDNFGIPHVRFTLQVGSGGTCSTVEARTLSLEAFQSRYREKVSSLMDAG